MNKQDLNALTEAWQSDTNWLNDKVDEMFKSSQDHAYALGLKRGLALRSLSAEEVLRIAEPFGAFEHGDAQGGKRIAFAQALYAAMCESHVPVQHTQRATGLVDCGECLNGCPAGKCRASSKGAQP